MRPIKIAGLAFVVLLTSLWLLAEPLLLQPLPYKFIAVRNAVVIGTGILGMGVMSLALMLATRPVVVEPLLGGLDKMYRLHKWLGITALVVASGHWAWTQAPGWLVSLGWWQRSARPRALPPQDELARWLQAQRGLAEGLGEWAFYATVLLIALALIKRFPYRLFFSTHRVLALAYLVLVFHSVVLMPLAYWGLWLGPVMALLLAGGSVASVALLFRRAGRSRDAFGVVEQVQYHASMKMLEVAVQLQSRWPGHLAGQFAFVRFDGDGQGDAEPHPFTLASAWQGDGRLLLLIKELGDYTTRLPTRLHAGGLVRVEGPYGQFNFESTDQTTGQIWIGGGIGITPFIARMKHLASHPEAGVVDLIHAVPHLDARASDLLTQDARAAQVRLHVMLDSRDGLLSGDRLRALVPDWLSRDIWFCGPSGMGTALRQDLRAHGLPAAAFHQELFSLR
jgi:predicted ferric reductase